MRPRCWRWRATTTNGPDDYLTDIQAPITGEASPNNVSTSGSAWRSPSWLPAKKVGLIAALCLLALCDLFSGSRSLLPNPEGRSSSSNRRASTTVMTTVRFSRSTTLNKSTAEIVAGPISPEPLSTLLSTASTMDPYEEIKLFLNKRSRTTAFPLHLTPDRATTKRHASKVSFCGDGIVDANEDCDCGGPFNCSKSHSKCCNSSSCTFLKGAECAEGPCCSRDCKLKSSRQVCRPAKNSCDLPEYCSGSSASCSADSFRRNGDDCGSGEGYCFNRMCMMRSDQCADVWGMHSSSAKNECYDHFNPRGLFNGNCGLEASNGSFKPCSIADVLCGSLQCKGGGQSPLLSSIPSFAATISANISGRIHQCKTISPEVVNPINILPTLVRDGTKCGSDKMCLKGHCIAFRHFLPLDRCPSQSAAASCSGHGVCSDLNVCSCAFGYSGADCSVLEVNVTSNWARRNAQRNTDMLNLRRGADAGARKTLNEVVDNDALQIVVIVMSAFLLGAMVLIMSLTCCRNSEVYVLTDASGLRIGDEATGSLV
ncbi:putative Disintegrin and metalloproteinase domain-containing protein 23 [Hypsibius exemplaris]|uniref:Disintegrin and metalloproteinase domain-containing protein 23 n=1 Tax=Hypsibius exemplaris TaxID=2072580 RepID=A0A1W0WG04_HYPEX|nr:putative Disintegrin and metalloproteinase domain-containing protein 23 [Hypsibius exemplaris]